MKQNQPSTPSNKTVVNQEQQAAIDLIYGPALVLAGPGSGKTTLLTKRIANILRQTDATSSNILCLTFSDTAVTTMQNKLVNLIGQSGYDIKVSTYHSFCSEMISENSGIFSDYLDARPADELISHQIIDKILNQIDYANSFKKFKSKSIYELIQKYKRAYISPNDLTAICLANLEEIKSLNQILNDYLEPSFKVIKKSLSIFESILEDILKLKQLETNKENLLSLHQLLAEDLAEAINNATIDDTTKPLTKWKNKWLSRDGQNLWQVDDARSSKNQLDFAVIYEQYNQQLQEQALYDYADMLLIAIDGLTNNLDLKYSLQERYQFLLLDEFQDTNEVQFKLVELLCDNPINEGRPNVMAVGDDDQAIYSFQGAHYSHMEKFYNNYHDVALFSLSINYRSSPGIVSLNNSLRQQIGQSIHLLPKTAKSSSNDQSDQHINRLELPLNIEQLAWVANFCHEMITNKRLEPEEIAIIAPKHNLLLDLIPFLHDKNIPINYIKKDNILDNDIIKQILTMSELIAGLNKRQNVDYLWPEVLSYDFWELSVQDIWHISNEAYNSRKEWADILLENESTREIALFILRLSQIMPYTSFEQSIDYIVGLYPLELKHQPKHMYCSPFYGFYFTDLKSNNKDISYNQFQLINQLSTIRQTIMRANDNEINLEQFCNLIRAYKSSEIKIIDNAAYSDNQHAINLLTIHSAKGREFDCVILLSVLDNVWGTKARNKNNVKLPNNLSFINIDNKSDDEKLRSFFVAVSRAKRQLIMTSYAKEIDGKPTLRLKYLNETETDNQQLISPLLPEANKLVKQTSFNIDDHMSERLTSWHNRHIAQINDPDTKLILKDNLERFKLSATTLNNFIDLVNSSPEQVFISELLKFPSAKSIDSKYGSVIHKTLDWRFKTTKLANSQPSLDATMAQLERLLDKLLIDDTEKQLLIKRATISLNAYYQQLPSIDNLSSLSEQQYNANIDNVKLTGKIDRIIVDDVNKQLTIIDFKTGKSFKESSNGTSKLYTNLNQLYFYKILIEGSNEFKSYVVTKGQIIHVEPDKAGLINCHDINFDQQQTNDKIKLIKAVYNCIVNLDFPDIESYSKDITGIKAFVEQLINNY